MSDIDFVQVLFRWRPGQLTLDDAADRCAATLRAIAATWEDCAVWTLGSSAATATRADDPELAQRLLPKLRTARDRQLYPAGDDSLGDANLSLMPSPYNSVSVALTHDNPKPSVGQLQIRCKGPAAARLADGPD